MKQTVLWAKQAPRQLRYGLVLRRHRRDGLKLHLGCGNRRIEGFINIDHRVTPAVDYVCDISCLPCPRHLASRIETYHVIEHIPRNAVKAVLAHWFDILQPGGVMVTECPDFDKDVEEYMAGNEERLGSIFGLQRFQGDAHYFGYNETRLRDLLISVGFVEIVTGPPEDYHAQNEPCLRVQCSKPRASRLSARPLS